MAKLAGAAVMMTDLNNERLAFAKENGADAVVNVQAENVAERPMNGLGMKEQTWSLMLFACRRLLHFQLRLCHRRDMWLCLDLMKERLRFLSCRLQKRSHDNRIAIADQSVSKSGRAFEWRPVSA